MKKLLFFMFLCVSPMLGMEEDDSLFNWKNSYFGYDNFLVESEILSQICVLNHNSDFTPEPLPNSTRSNSSNDNRTSGQRNAITIAKASNKRKSPEKREVQKKQNSEVKRFKESSGQMYSVSCFIDGCNQKFQRKTRPQVKNALLTHLHSKTHDLENYKMTKEYVHNNFKTSYKHGYTKKTLSIICNKTLPNGEQCKNKLTGRTMSVLVSAYISHLYVFNNHNQEEIKAIQKRVKLKNR